MRSRAARLTLGAVAVMLFGAAAFFLFTSEQTIAGQQDRLRAFDLRAREATDTFAELRAAQQAYVAAGQGIAFWMPKVASTAEAAGKTVSELRASAASTSGRSSLDDAAATLVEFGAVDKRARDYLTSGQELMAADVVFTEGGETAASGGRQIEAARLAEQQAFDASAAHLRRQEAAALAGAGIFGTLVMLVLALARPAAASAAPSLSLSEPRSPAVREAPARVPPVRVPASLVDTGGLSLRESPPVEVAPATAARIVPPLRTTAALCTDFGRVREFKELGPLVSRAADVMEASGVVVWLGNTAGVDLRPVLAHGYSDQTLARMPTVPRSGHNAAAAAYRTSVVQIVLSQPGGSTGAIVAPLLSADGCIGALSVEVKGGGEASDTVQALAAIFAAQLAGVLSVPAADADAVGAPSKAAAQG